MLGLGFAGSGVGMLLDSISLALMLFELLFILLINKIRFQILIN